MTTDFRDRLAALADTPDAPPSAVDVGRAVRDGRRRLLRNRMAGGAGAAVLAAAAAVAVLAAAPGVTSAPVTPGPTTVSPGGGSVGRQLPGTDPLIQKLAFGWLPPGYAVSGYTTGGVRAYLAQGATATSPAFAVSVEPTERTSGGTDDQGKLFSPMAATVAGSPAAFWWSTQVPDPVTNGGTYLTWQIPGHGWGELLASNVQGMPDWQTALPRIAAGIRFVDEPVPLPFHIDGLPRELQVYTAEFIRNPASSDSPAWEAAVSLVDAGQSVIVTARPLPGPPSTSARFGLECRDSGGLSICVQALTGAPAALADIGGSSGLLDRITSLGPDPAGWTTGVIVSAS